MKLQYLALGASLAVAGVALAQGHEHSVGRNLPDVEFTVTPGLPDCARNAVMSGDPSKGPSIILGKIAAGFEAGGYAMMPARHVHQFSCLKDCVMYVHSDGPFDIHYVDN